MDGRDTAEYIKAKEDPNFAYSTCLTWFFDSFYQQFFILSPDVIPMFANVSIVAQGRLLAGVISSALSLLRNKDVLRKKMVAMTKKHNGKGVKAEHYGTMGQALILALHKVLGDLFDDKCKTAWARVYSFLLSIIIPEVVKFEEKELQIKTSAKVSSWSDSAFVHVENALAHGFKLKDVDRERTLSATDEGDKMQEM